MAVLRGRQGTQAFRRAAPRRALLGVMAWLGACSNPHFDVSVEAGTGLICGAAPCDAGAALPPLDAAPAARDATVDPPREDGAVLGDAGTQDSATLQVNPDDAGPLSAQQKARELMQGKYALRARFYAKDLATGAQFLSQEITWLADVTVDQDDKLQLLAQICEDHAVGSGPLPNIWATLLYPEKTAPRRFEIVLDDNDGFHTVGDPYLIGYTAASPDVCKTKLGQTVAGPSGTCLCASSDTAPPLRANDCRVFDSDEDGAPGYSVKLTGFISRTDHVRHLDKSQIVMGKISAQKKHAGTYQYNHDHYTFECGMPSCPVTEYEPCLLSESQALFQPLPERMPSGAAWTCEELLRRSQAGEFFPLTPLARSCQ